MPSKKFKFRLEPLLKVRAHREKECQRDLAEAVSQVQDQKTALSIIDADRESTVESQRDMLQGTIVPAHALTFSRFLLKLKKERIAGNHLLTGLEKKAEEKRKILIQATKEKKTFEKLKERQVEKHYYQLNREEQMQLDELATMAHTRKKARLKDSPAR